MTEYIFSQLILENGAIFTGRSPSWQHGTFYGESVFTTGMTGYPETLTDPSYAGQIITFTFPLIGNYGIPIPDHWESAKIHAHGIVLSQLCHNWNHHSGKHSLEHWCKEQNVPLITGVDTRALTKMLRNKGTMLGAITTESKKRFQFANGSTDHLVSRVSCKEKTAYSNGKKVIIAVDCGIKENIIRSLLKFPITVVKVPFDYDYSHDQYDGIFLSNGPGDPVQCTRTIEILQKALQKKKPIFGICLGTQLMALAAGAKTYKLPFGHRSQNQPCLDIETNKCYITSQNHGYAIDERSLPKDWKVTFRNLNDGSVEGIKHTSSPHFSVQFHPEATPGPTDTLWLFEKFYQSL